MLGTCSDIVFAMIKLSQFSANPSKEHFEQTKYICHYLAGIHDYTMVFDGNTNEGLIVHSDSDWTADINNCCSITGYFFKLASNTHSWGRQRACKCNKSHQHTQQPTQNNLAMG